MKISLGVKSLCFLLLCGSVISSGPGRALAAVDYSNETTYTKSPAFITEPVQPLTMLLLDNTGSMGNHAYSGTYPTSGTIPTYYGLFEPDKYYYHPFNTGVATSVCNYTGITGSCSTTTGASGECKYPTRTCTVTTGGKSTCYRAAGTVTTFTNSSCDGPDSGDGSDCASGQSCTSNSGTKYSCRTPDLVTGSTTYTSDTCSGNCDNPYSCGRAYVCSNATGGTVYGDDRCDADNDGTGDCGSGNTCVRKRNSYPSGSTTYYACFDLGGTSGSYTESTCNDSCGTAGTCVTNGTMTYYTCQARASGDGTSYNNTTCDGSDGNTTTDCDSGYSCVPAYQCTKRDQTTKYFATSNCADYRDENGNDLTCRTSDGWRCSATGTAGTPENWTGKYCADCVTKGGVCTDTGFLTDSSYNCDLNATTRAKCQTDYADAVCNPVAGGTSTCEWTDLLMRAACEAAGCTSGTIVQTTNGAKQASCATAADIAACQGPTGQKYLDGKCETSTTTGTTRASYWRKTPTTPPGQNCTTGNCVGGTVTLGNILNHDQMTQMDVAKKVLIGGMRAPVSSIANTIELDGDYNNTTTTYLCSGGTRNGTVFTSRSSCTSTSSSGCVGSGGTCSSVTIGNNGNIVLEESESTADTAPTGILQRNKGLAWGFGVLNSPDGGIIKNYVASDSAVPGHLAAVIQSINDTDSNGSTDLAESLNTVVNYFRQVAPEYNTGEYTRDCMWDPFKDKASCTYIPCGRASTIVITDGEPNQDDKFNTTIKNYANNNSTGITDFITPTSGTNTYYMDDVAYWAHTHDLRTEPDMGGDQKLDVYMIYAFGGDPVSAAKLQNAAVLGGFTDKNNDGKPNSKSVEAGIVDVDKREWDMDKDALHVPDNYADASDGAVLGTKLQAMLGQVQQKAAAGSAASVISASRSGEGAIFQAIFYAATPPDADKRSITWVGDVHSLWLDDFGNMREDCGASDTGTDCSTLDAVLNPKTDKIIEFFTDATTGEAMIRSFNDPEGDGQYISGVCSKVVPGKSETEIREFDCQNLGGIWSYDSTNSDYITTVSMKSFTHWLWSAGNWLATPTTDTTSMATQRAYASATKGRYIFTQDTVAGGAIPFMPANMKTGFGSLNNYQNYLGASSETDADNIVNWVRGNEVTGFRSRVYDWGSGAVVNRLGDVIGSTPMLVAKPAEDYDTVYSDPSYQLFRKAYDKRRTVVYAGGNDGGLHAYNGGYFDRTTKTYLPKPSAASTSYALGSEMWMYVPKSLLPHLKWLTDPKYSHVYYVDMKPYIFDAKIFADDTWHVGGWGTILVGGMGFGGGDINVTTSNNNGVGVGVSTTTTLHSSYFLLDVTDPEREPVLLGEFSDPNLGFTLAAPTAIPILDCDRKTSNGSDCTTKNWPMHWYLALGSGPHSTDAAGHPNIRNAYAGESDQTAKAFVLDLKSNPIAPVSGSPFSTTLTNSYFSDMIAVDYDLDFKTDVLYFGSVANTKAVPMNLSGAMHRLVTNESNTTSLWYLNTMFNAGRPVSAAPAAATDGSRLWVYFGTGRLVDQVDKGDSSQQSYFGIKENYDNSNVVNLSGLAGANLVDVTKVAVGNDADGTLYDNTSTSGATIDVKDTSTAAGVSLGVKSFKELNYKMSEKVSALDHYNGWRLNFSRSKERNLGQAALLGEVLTFTTYAPSSNVCSSDGESYLWALYYRTGTSYYKPIIGTANLGGHEVAVRDADIGRGMTLTPSVHTGAEDGSKAFIQTSTGAIISIDQKNPGVTKSRVISWRDRDPD